MPTRTASASCAPAAAATIARLSRQRRVWSPIEPPTSSPVSGSTGVWPERKTRPLEMTAWEYGPGGGRAGVRGDRFAMMGHGAAKALHELASASSRYSTLAHETSPYLLQHKDNPVDWHPWGEEALPRAREQQKPLLVSIGYSACHWCHVMERESFEDPAVAALMNEHFVLRQGRPRGAPGRRRDLHGRRAGDDRPRRLAAERLPHARRRAVLRRHLLPARAAPGHAELADGARGRRARVGRAARRDHRRRRADRRPRCRRRRSSQAPDAELDPAVARRRGRPRCGAATTPSTAAGAARRSSRPRR